jgi:hypothetical protein
MATSAFSKLGLKRNSSVILPRYDRNLSATTGNAHFAIKYISPILLSVREFKQCLHIAWLELKRSADGGCRACEVLVTCVDAYFNAEFIGLRRASGDSIDQATAEKLLRIHLHLSRGAMKLGIGWANKNGLFDQCEIYTEFGHQVSPWRGLGAAGTVARETLGSLEVLLGWIHNCMIKHPICNSNVGTLPLRVVDVGRPGNQQPFLHVSRRQPDFYIALSHCWRTSSLLQTRNSNIDSHRAGIPWVSLSETFQNAILITQNLGIRYPWIDSLCILQDNTIYWEAQSAEMAIIYSNAQVVLAATDAKTARVGCCLEIPFISKKGLSFGRTRRRNLIASTSVMSEGISASA